MKKLALVLLIMLLCACLSGCNDIFSTVRIWLGIDETEKPAEIPYLEHYLMNAGKIKSSASCKEYPYKDLNSTPMIMGGLCYYGGFCISNTARQYQPGYATFDLTGLNYQNISFVLGSMEYGWSGKERCALVAIYVDGQLMMDEIVLECGLPSRFTVSVEGASEITFRITEGDMSIGVAELTGWSGQPEVTGPVPSAEPNKLQLIQDLLPYCTSGGTVLYTNHPIDSEMFPIIRSVTVSNDGVIVGGMKYQEGLSIPVSESLIGVDRSFVSFNTEGNQHYLSCKIGIVNSGGEKKGKSWVAIYADGERIYEEKISSYDPPQNIFLEIGNCRQLVFEFIYVDGGPHHVAVVDAYVAPTRSLLRGESVAGSLVKKMPDVAKLVSNLSPYAISSDVDLPIYNGKNSQRTFCIAGQAYEEGILFRADKTAQYGNSGAFCCFDLKEEFHYLTFVAGLLDGSNVLGDDKLNIYLDGKLVRTIELSALALPQRYVVDLNYAGEFKIELVGKDRLLRPTYGIAEMTVYKKELMENRLFEHNDPDLGERVTLIEQISPYRLYSNTGSERALFNGNNPHRYFMIGNRKISTGMILATSVYRANEAIAEQIATAKGLSDYPPLAVVAANVVHESAFAVFNLGGNYSKLTFTVACKKTVDVLEHSSEDQLIIGCDDTAAQIIRVSENMEPTTYTVDLQNCKRLMFWLQCGDNSSAHYAIYNMTLEK